MRRFAAPAVLLILASGGCAAPTEEGETTPAEPSLRGKNACFYRRQVQDFDTLGRDTLVVYAPSRRNAYLVKISPPSAQLRFADAIAFESRAPQICGRAGERLRVGTGALNLYSVMDVRRLPEDQLADILDSYGQGEGGDDIQPETSTEAEIEPLENGGDE